MISAQTKRLRAESINQNNACMKPPAPAGAHWATAADWV
jgi:hypothetical protein